MADSVDFSEQDGTFSFTATYPAGVIPTGVVVSVTEAMNAFLHRNGCIEAAEYSLNIALEELLTNLAKYGKPEPRDDGYGNDRDVGTVVAEGSVTLADGAPPVLRIRDNCIPFDPRNAGSPEFSEDPLDRPIGGLGLYMLLNMFDLRYRREDDGNVSVWTWREETEM